MPERDGLDGSGRAALYVIALAWRRVRRRSSGALLAAAGIAVGAAVLIGVLAGTKIAQDRSVAQQVERIPAASRSVRAVWFGVPVGASERYVAIDETIRESLGGIGIGLAGPTAIVLFRESTIAGHFVSLAGVDGLANHVRLASGRLPRRVRPTCARCSGCVAGGRCPAPRDCVSSRSAPARCARVAVRRLSRAHRQCPRRS